MPIGRTARRECGCGNIRQAAKEPINGITTITNNNLNLLYTLVAALETRPTACGTLPELFKMSEEG